MCAVFDRMTSTSFWADESELAALFQELCTSNSSERKAQRILENTRVHVVRSSESSEGGSHNTLRGPSPHRLHTVYEIQRLAISYQPHWPLNMFVDESNFEKYNELFVFLSQVLSGKHALHRLFSAKWSQNAIPEIKRLWSEQKVDFLRHEISHFVCVLHQYVVDQVLGSDWNEVCDLIEGASTVKALREAHKNFLSKASDKVCILLAARTRNILQKVLEFCYLCQGKSFPQGQDVFIV